MAILVPASDFVALADSAHHLRHQFKQIANQAVIGDLEDRRIGILVDGDDDFRLLHPGKVLDGAGNTDGNVKLRGDDLAGLTDLIVIGHKAGIDGGTGGAQRCTELVGERFEQGVVVFATAQTTTAGDDDLGGTEFGTLGLGEFAVGQRALGGVGSRADAFDFGGIFPVDRVKGGGAHGDDFDGIDALDGGEGIAGVDGADEGVSRFDAGDFGDLGDIEQGRDAGHEVLAEGGGRGEDVAVAGSVGDDQCGEVLGGLGGVVGGVGNFDDGHAAEGGCVLGGGVAVGTGDEEVYFATDLLGGRDGVEGGGLEGGVVVFGNNENGHGVFLRSLSLHCEAY